jgi:chemotaxis methyl-accepting protein methylase
MQRALVSAVAPVVSTTVGFRQTTSWRRFRHSVALLANKRINSHFTGFVRLPTQFEALSGPVISALSQKICTAKRLQIAVLGCSNGAEAYSVASILRRRHPNLDFDVRGYDIDPDCVQIAKGGRYHTDEIFNNRVLPRDFVCSTFNQIDGAFVVKEDIARHVRFDVCDVRSRYLFDTVGPCDIVFAQNVIFHLKRPVARMALRNIATLLRRGSALFIDGVDLDVRARFTEQMGLHPLTYELEQIHNEARRARGVGWPYQYWGLEPFLDVPDPARRYATIFLAS